MEKINFNYSLKNIPIPAKDNYIKCFIGKEESLIRHMRWKAVFFDKNENDNELMQGQTYGFNSEKTPPQNSALTPFEDDLYALMNSIKFSQHQSEFQQQLSKDRKKIQTSPCIFVPADKTTNVYKVPVNEYKKLLSNNVTANYKKAEEDLQLSINQEAREIATQYSLENRIECLAKREAFLTLKDHKDNFENNPKCRLLNPCKSEIGVISKHHLQEINNSIREKTLLLQWKNTDSVLTWFTGIKSKHSKRFLQMDIVDFYPSISEQLLHKAITYAKTLVPIDQRTVDLIFHTRKSLLFTSDGTWVKKSGSIFDVTMGSYDGAEICELVGLYLLHLIKIALPTFDFGLYRDDGLGCYDIMPGPQTERTKKVITKIFKENGFSITIDMNLLLANFLDVSLDMKTCKFKPFRKPLDKPLYINTKSNHPPTIIKEIPKMVQKRLSQLSSTVDEFENAKPDYCEALSKSGFEGNITFEKPAKKKRKRKKNIIWFNPPYNVAVETNIGKRFLSLVDKHFPKHHKYNKIFNRTTLKLNYSCTPNIKTIISSHNKKSLMKRMVQHKQVYATVKTALNAH